MENKILRNILILCIFLVICIFFLYRGFNWPLGAQGIEAIGVLGILVIALISFILCTKKFRPSTIQKNSVGMGLWIGLLWTVEISMNNILRPPLPGRDIYDNIFWGIIALFIFGISISYAVKTKKIMNGILAGLWSGFATGAVACLTALVFIVFGMSFILSDALNIAEWAVRGSTSNTPNITVYFAYQTLAGAIMHLIILGIIMGFLLGIIGGLVGVIILKKFLQ